MIERNHLTVANPAQEKLALYQRAAQLGNKTAITAYQVELAEVQNAERGRVQQLQQQQMMLQMLGVFFVTFTDMRYREATSCFTPRRVRHR